MYAAHTILLIKQVCDYNHVTDFCNFFCYSNKTIMIDISF